MGWKQARDLVEVDAAADVVEVEEYRLDEERGIRGTMPRPLVEAA
jgi:hypothetical protein